jgi:hypothetical protein
MTDEKVEEIVRQSLEAQNLWIAVNRSRSLFLKTDHIFAHVVLNDASNYEKALNALRTLQIQLETEHQKLEWLLRSQWEIIGVEYRGPYYEGGHLYAASDIIVTLQSGSRVQTVRVAFSHQAGDDLRQELHADPTDYERLKQEKVKATRKYIELLLSASGRDNSWDPLWPGCDHEQINSDGLAWILQQEAWRKAKATG